MMALKMSVSTFMAFCPPAQVNIGRLQAGQGLRGRPPTSDSSALAQRPLTRWMDNNRVQAPAGPPGQVLAYARLLADRVDESLGGRLRAAYLHGSAVLGGWQPERSDVDMLFVAENAVRGPEVTAAAAVLAAREPGVPVSGLECSVVSAGQAARARAPWPFLLHVAHGSGEDQVQVVDGGARPGDRDLLMHYTVCRAAGWPVRGPAPAELIGSVPRPVVLGYLADELR